MHEPVYIYYHDDFDGIVSCVLIYYFLRAKGYEPCIEMAVDFEVFDRQTWLKYHVKKPFATVDFAIYRPDVLIFFDHHQKIIKKSKNTKIFVLDEKSDSCAQIILNQILKEKIKLPSLEKIKELVKWTNIIDKAKYPENKISAKKTVKPKHSALKITLALASKKYLNYDINKKIIYFLIKNPSIDELAKKPFILEAIKKIQPRMIETVKKFKRHSKYYRKKSIVVYDSVDTEFVRYAPCIVFPKHIISIGLSKDEKGSYEVKVMGNPWNKKSIEILKKKKINLGELMKKYDGGGHPFIGSSNADCYEKGRDIFKKVVDEIKKRL